MLRATLQTITLIAEPVQALVDQPVSIRLTTVPPQQTVTLHARVRDDNNIEWHSSATFQADHAGTVDVSSQQPVAGTYHKADPMGLFWSMRPIKKSALPFFTVSSPKALKIELNAEIKGHTVASTCIQRQFTTEAAVRVPVNTQGLVGTLYHPGEAGVYPAIIILSGSDGQPREIQAALLASYGYAALTLSYFNAEGLPKSLVHIPLEYFETAIHWLQEQDYVQSDKIGVIGLSRGGELALLLGATFPELKAVIACSPCGLIQAGIDKNDYTRSAWTYQEKPLQQATVKWTPGLRFKLTWQSFRQWAFPMRDMFLTTLNDREHRAEATIAVEKTQGPILLISGDDDQMWPADIFSELVMQRLRECKHPYPDQHLCYKSAGHFVSFPYGYPFLPPAIKRVQGVAVGGTIESTAASVADSWPKILTFFEQHLHSSTIKMEEV